MVMISGSSPAIVASITSPFTTGTDAGRGAGKDQVAGKQLDAGSTG